MKSLSWIFLILLFPGAICAQIDYSVSRFSQTYNFTNMQSDAMVEIIDGVATMRYSQHEHLVKGSPYLDDEFLFGVMSTVEAIKIEGLKYRYDIYADEMQFILKDDTASITKPLTLRSIQIGDKIFIYDVYETGENMVAAGYFEVIEGGKLTGLLRREMELEQDIYTPNYGGGGGTKDFYYKDSEQHYVKFNKDVAIKVSNKKQFLEIIPYHKNKVKAFIKSEKISVKNSRDFKKLIAYYNTLLEG
jgi:hypothetical protein